MTSGGPRGAEPDARTAVRPALRRSIDDRPEPLLYVADAVASLLFLEPARWGSRDALASAALGAAMGRSDIAIERRPSGRPRLAPPLPELAVSMATRPPLLLVGASTTGRVGVDLETMAALGDADPASLARDHFSDAEARAVARCRAVDEARRLFLRLWIVKEAVLKATGRGVYDGLAAPDLGGQLDALEQDGRVLELARPGGDVMHVATTRRVVDDGVVFCALAVTSCR